MTRKQRKTGDSSRAISARRLTRCFARSLLFLSPPADIVIKKRVLDVGIREVGNGVRKPTPCYPHYLVPSLSSRFFLLPYLAKRTQLLRAREQPVPKRMHKIEKPESDVRVAAPSKSVYQFASSPMKHAVSITLFTCPYTTYHHQTLLRPDQKTRQRNDHPCPEEETAQPSPATKP